MGTKSRSTAFLLTALLAAACGGGQSSSSTAPAGPTPSPPSGTTGAFRMAVLLSASRVPSSADVARVVARASDVLYLKTGSTLSQTDLVAAGPGSAYSQAMAYVWANSAAPPDGVLAFSDDFDATNFGGYSQTFSLPWPSTNGFPSPFLGGNKAYLAVVDFFHMYARCGYDDAGNRIGDRSAGGECRNQSGLACVDNGRYWMCPNTLSDLYADPDYFIACIIVHEFLHPFGSEGSYDHYGTAQCTSRTGMSAADAQSLNLFQQSCGVCPDVFSRFRHR